MRKMYARMAALAAVFLAAGAAASAQESISNAGRESGAQASGPAAALRDVLSAACTHNEREFSKFLTARNAEEFAKMAENARLALMRRFVLLRDAGKPKVSVNAPGRPSVTCQTEAGGAEIQIGGADEQDNLAMLPVELRDAGDPKSENPMRIKMGLIRENGQWKLISVGLLLLDLPALEAQWDTEEEAANESAAIESLKALAAAIETYRKTYTRLPPAIASLGTPLKGNPSADAAGVVDADLANGKKDGYLFRYVIVGASDLGAPAKFELSAMPAVYGRTGVRSFFRDETGRLHAADHRGGVGSAIDPKAE